MYEENFYAHTRVLKTIPTLLRVMTLNLLIVNMCLCMYVSATAMIDQYGYDYYSDDLSMIDQIMSVINFVGCFMGDMCSIFHFLHAVLRLSSIVYPFYY
ncbi:hypothetical protein PENTCL1PPCAC_5030, partial [Pristionchus entomophagus]